MDWIRQVPSVALLAGVLVIIIMSAMLWSRTDVSRVGYESIKTNQGNAS